jgi:hypothetical protein
MKITSANARIPAVSVCIQVYRGVAHLDAASNSVLAQSFTGLFDADVPYVIDLDYWRRLLRYGDTYYLPELLASFRVSRGSWSVRIEAGQSAEFRRFIAKSASDPALQIRYCDVVAGNVLACLNAFLRMWIYRMTINEKNGIVP